MKSNLKFLALFLLAFVGSIFADTFPPGVTVILTVTADGTQPFVYEWKKDGIKIHDQSGPILTIPNFSQNNAGIYTCTVNNLSGEDSASIVLSVTPPVSLPVSNVSISAKSG